MSSEFVPDQETLEQVRALIEELFTLAPDIMGIDEIIPGCSVINIDPYATGVYPRYIRVALRGGYHVDAYYWGTPALAVGSICTVTHLREGDRYEVTGGGAGAVLPWLAIWQYDISAGTLIPHATIVAAIAACAAGDYVLIPPGTYDEAITLAANVYVVEQIPGTVIINRTLSTTAVTGAADGYINIKEIRIVRNAAENSYAVYHIAAGNLCRVIVERIYAQNNNANAFTYGVYFNSTGSLDVYCKEMAVVANDRFAFGIQHLNTGTCNVWLDQASITSENTPTFAFMSGTGTLNVYGPAVQLTATGTPTTVGAINCNAAGTLNIHDLKLSANHTGTGNMYCVSCQTAGASVNIYDSVIHSSTAGGIVTYGGYATNGTLSFYHCDITGHTTFDLIQTAGILNVHACRYDTTNGTITQLAGDRTGSTRGEVISGEWQVTAVRLRGDGATILGHEANAGEKWGDVRQAATRELYPDVAGWGVFSRIANRAGIATYDWHFRTGDPTPPTGYAWQGAPFVAPGLIQYAVNADYLQATATAANRSFMSTAIANNAGAWANKSIYARIRTGLTTQIGVRFDDGTDNNYAEVRTSGAAADATQNLTFVWRQGGGVTTVASNLIIPADTFIVVHLFMYTGGASYEAFGYIISEEGSGINVTGFNHDFGGAGPFPAAGRVGIIVENAGNPGAVDWMLENFG